MSKQFAEFKINETFSLESTSSGIDGDKINPKEGATPYITRGINENGIRQYVTDAQPGNWEKDKGNVITIGLDTQTAYYQPVPFITGQNIHVLSHESMSQRVAMYIVPQLKKLMLKYSWGGNGATLGRLSQDTLVLPVTDTTANTPNPEPDWEYMENYIRTIERKYIDQIAEHNSKEQTILEQLHPESENTKPEAHGFEDFCIDETFTLKSTSSGINGDKLNEKQGRTPYVTRSVNKNGIKQYVTDSQPGKWAKDDGNVITIGLDTQTAYYQPVPFITGQNVHILKHEKLSQSTAMYIIPQLTKLMLKYSWGGNGATLGRLSQDSLTLPVTANGEIDWDYMEHYITWIETRERERVESYVQHVKNRS